jgi:hypothetical protein
MPDISAVHRAYEELPNMMKERFKMHQAQGFSGLLGGFAEELQYLHDVGGQVMPEDHPNREALEVYTKKIAGNSQWPWQHKVRAVKHITAGLLRGAEFAAERNAADKGNAAGS